MDESPRSASVARVRAIGLFAAIGVAIGSGIALGCFAPESPVARHARDPESLKRGKGLFVGTCGAYCHGLRPGNRDAPYLFDCEWKHGSSDQQIFDVIRAGVPQTRMQGFTDRLPQGDEDIWRIVAFLKSRSSC